MAKLLRIDRKLRTLGRRLTTDANGAPCCCTASPCPCNASVPLRTWSYVSCLDNRMIDANGNTIVTPYPRSFRVLSMTVNYQVERTSAYSIVNVQYGRYAVVERVEGYATFCNPDLYPIGTGWNPYTWPLADASQAYEYQFVSQRLQSVQVAENYVGFDALSIHRPIVTQGDINRRTDIRIFGAVVPGADARFWFPSVYAFAPDVGLPFDPWSCNAVQSSTSTSRGIRSVDTRQIRFTQSDQAGAYQLVTSKTQTVLTDTQQVNRDDLRVTVGWSVRLLACTTGGDPTGSLIGEPGCSNCFDPSLLEPM